MFILGLGLLGSIFLSFGCLVAGIKSLLSISQSYDSESRLMAIGGFIGGVLASAFFGYLTIRLLDMMSNMMAAFAR